MSGLRARDAFERVARDAASEQRIAELRKALGARDYAE